MQCEFKATCTARQFTVCSTQSPRAEWEFEVAPLSTGSECRQFSPSGVTIRWLREEPGPNGRRLHAHCETACARANRAGGRSNSVSRCAFYLFATQQEP